MPAHSRGHDAPRAVLDPASPPASRAALHRFVRDVLGANVALAPLLDVGVSDAPMDYLAHAFFEGFTPRADLPTGAPRQPAATRPSDCVVWANRGGGKTFLGAVATVLDLIFKPGIEVRILGGSLEQSRRMYEHLRRLVEIPAVAELLDAKPGARSLRLVNGSRVEVLAQSESSVRGTRVQKLRCDEVELFDRDLWYAAQLTTRSLRLSGPWGQWVRGSVEALSTMHRPYGLMWEVVGSATRTGEDAANPVRRLFRWGVVDVLERCTDEHACATCSLNPDCAGRAKTRPADAAGHLSVADAVAMKSRVDEASWRAEMLCLRPRRSACVYPEFSPDRHVVTGGHDLPQVTRESVNPLDPDAGRPRTRFDVVCGMDFGYRGDSVLLVARIDPGPGTSRPTITVLDEIVVRETTVDRHIEMLRKTAWVRAWGEPVWIGADPAGEQRSAQTGRSCADVLRAMGFKVRDRRVGLHDGLALVRRRLAPADGSPPRLFIHARCVRLIEAMERYHFPEDQPESLVPVKDGMDHAADALRYLVTGLDCPNGAKLGRWA
jgi:hypothetical protein